MRLLTLASFLLVKLFCIKEYPALVKKGYCHLFQCYQVAIQSVPFFCMPEKETPRLLL